MNCCLGILVSLTTNNSILERATGNPAIGHGSSLPSGGDKSLVLRDVAIDALDRRHGCPGLRSLFVEKEDSRVIVERQEIIVVRQQYAIFFPTKADDFHVFEPEFEFVLSTEDVVPLLQHV